LDTDGGINRSINLLITSNCLSRYSQTMRCIRCVLVSVARVVGTAWIRMRRCFLSWPQFVRVVTPLAPQQKTIIEDARIFQLGVGQIRSYDNPVHQLEEGHPTSGRCLDDTNQHHLVEGDIVVGHPPLPIPLRLVDRDSFAVLITIKCIPISQPPSGIKLTIKNWHTRLPTCLTNLSMVTGFLKGVWSLSWTCCSEGA
jgi:hypothetical protein